MTIIILSTCLTHTDLEKERPTLFLGLTFVSSVVQFRELIMTHTHV